MDNLRLIHGNYMLKDKNLKNTFIDFDLYQDSCLLLMLSECKWTSIIHHQPHKPHSMLWNQWKQKPRSAKEHIKGWEVCLVQTQVATACRSILHLLKPKSLFLRLAKPMFLPMSGCQVSARGKDARQRFLSTSMFVRKDPCLTSRKGCKHLHPDMGVLLVGVPPM